MTGWRIGYACANDVIAKVMANYVSHSTGSPVAISQRAAAVALSGSQAEIETMRQAFEQRRNYIVERMNAIPGVSCIQPEGAFYVMMNLEQLLGKTIHGVEITNDDVFADAFLKYGLVAVVPGSGFERPTSSAGPTPLLWKISKRAWTVWKNFGGMTTAKQGAELVSAPVL